MFNMMPSWWSAVGFLAAYTLGLGLLAGAAFMVARRLVRRGLP